MAEYYPLISRAVAGLRGGAPAARQAIYGRAKTALIGQLRGMQPPVPDEAIEREVAALDDAIARIEAELVAAPAETASEPAQTPPPSAVAPAPTETAPQAPDAPPASVATKPPVPPAAAAPAEAPASALSPPPATTPAAASPSTAPRSDDPRPQGLPSPPRPSVVRPPAPPAKVAAGAPARVDRAVFERRTTLPTARPITPRPPASAPPAQKPLAAAPAADEASEQPDAKALEPRSPEPASSQGRPEPTPIGPGTAGSPAPTAERQDGAAVPLPAAPTLRASDLGPLPDELLNAAPFLRARSDDEDVAGIAPPVPDILASDIRPREEGIRPAIPRQTVRPPRDLRVWIVAIAALAAVVAIALTAWKLRDNPEELARAPTPAKQEQAPGKIVERADGPTDDADADTAVASPALAPTASQAPAATAATGPATAAAQQPVGDQAIAVAYKAAILVSAPDLPEKVKTYVGTVVWRTESVTQGQNQPLGTEVRADVDVPDAKFQAVIELRRNTEAQFPASHTIDIKFTVGAGSPIGNVKQIDVPGMRSEDAPSGDPLIGVPVTITSNYFLVGLTRGAAEKRNLDAIRTHGWFDIPMVLENGTPAKITFEKGPSGDRIIADALATWSRS